MKCKPFCRIILSTVVTCFSVFALGAWDDFVRPEPPKVPSRKALFEEGFRQLPFAVRFAAQSPEFISQLTEAEMQQLTGVFSITEGIVNERQWGSARDPWGSPIDRSRGSEKKSLLPELKFSDNPEDFNLNSGEKLRLAKTTEIFSDPIVVNLNYLNSPSISPKYIEILQTLFHEVGHKISRGKDQVALDSVAAKWVRFLAPYYHVVEQTDPQKHYGAVRVELLSLPITFKATRTDISDSPRVIVSAADQVEFHILAMDYVVGPLKRFTNSFEGGPFREIQEEISLRITNLRLIDLPGFYADIKVNIEVQTHLVVQGPDYFPSGVVAGIPGSLTQYVEMRARTVTVMSPEVVNIDTAWGIPKPLPQDYRNPQYISPRGREWDYRDKTLENRVLSVTQAPLEIRVAMSGSEDISDLQLRLQDEDANLLLEGKRGSLAGKKSQWQFVIPKNISSKSGQVKIRDVIVNSQSRSLLPEVLTIPTAKNNSEEPFSLSKVSFFNGRDWVTYKDVLELPPGPARMRIVVEGKESFDKVYLRWNMGTSLIIGKAEASSGVWGAIHEEVIRDFKLIETSGDQRTYEFISRGVLKTVFPQVVEGVRTVDSGRRFLKEINAVNSKMQSASRVFTNHLMIFNREYIGVKSRAGIVRCETVF